MIFSRFHNFWLPPAYVISLAETPEREAEALLHLNDECGFNVKPYHGFHGKRMGLASAQQTMTPGMIGCMLGHMSLWKTLLASDEEAFRVLNGRGLTALVRTQYRFTAAQVWLRPPDELIAFLNGCAEACGGAAPVRQ